MREYIIQMTDKMLKALGMPEKRAKKHELIRCRNCYHYHEGRYCILTQFPCRDRDYCSWAEKEETDAQ